MPNEHVQDILAERTECILYYAGPGLPNEHCAGWIGGNAPEFFDDLADRIHGGNSRYLFYLSLVHPFQPKSMISIFIPEEYEEYLENSMYPDCPIKVIEHPVSAESAKELFTHPGFLKHAISAGERSKDGQAMDQSFLIKVGGTPRLIQNEDYYFAKLEESFSFFFQVDEDGYPDTLLRDDYSYPFSYGALYIFAKMGADEVHEPVAGFWQFS